MEHEKEIDTCPICLDEIGEKNNCVTECGHKFCLKCLSIALQGNNTCPMCRDELVSKSEDAIENERLNDLTLIFARESCSNRREIKRYKDIYVRSMMKIQEGTVIQEQLKKDVAHRSLIIKLKNTTPDEWRKRWRLISRLAVIGLDYKPSFLLSK
tara:strand:+ start:507 stop:971 length:465 start_codon:yes stop_codon:yes gene_type:complete